MIRPTYELSDWHLIEDFLLCLPSEVVGTCWFTFVRSVCLLSLCLCVFSICMSHSFHSWPALYICKRSNTRRWSNAGLMLVHHLQRWPYISPVSGYHTCLTPRWMWASITDGGPTFIQLWFNASCWYRQHELLTRAEWILPSTDDAGPTFNRHWIGFSLYSVQQKALSSVQWLMVRTGDGGPAMNRHWVDVSCLLGIVW